MMDDEKNVADTLDDEAHTTLDQPVNQTYTTSPIKYIPLPPNIYSHLNLTYDAIPNVITDNDCKIALIIRYTGQAINDEMDKSGTCQNILLHNDYRKVKFEVIEWFKYLSSIKNSVHFIEENDYRYILPWKRELAKQNIPVYALGGRTDDFMEQLKLDEGVIQSKIVVVIQSRWVYRKYKKLFTGVVINRYSIQSKDPTKRKKYLPNVLGLVLKSNCSAVRRRLGHTVEPLKILFE